jgi:hypothetical protein
MPESPQAVAYALLQQIALAEDWSKQGHSWQGTPGPWQRTRAEILTAYKECLEAVLGKYYRWGSYTT